MTAKKSVPWYLLWFDLPSVEKLYTGAWKVEVSCSWRSRGRAHRFCDTVFGAHYEGDQQDWMSFLGDVDTGAVTTVKFYPQTPCWSKVFWRPRPSIMRRHFRSPRTECLGRISAFYSAERTRKHRQASRNTPRGFPRACWNSFSFLRGPIYSLVFPAANRFYLERQKERWFVRTGARDNGSSKIFGGKLFCPQNWQTWTNSPTTTLEKRKRA